MNKMIGLLVVAAVLLIVGVVAEAGQVVSGTFDGTGAPLFIGIGFKPDYVRLVNCESIGQPSLAWSKHMRAADCIEGVITSNGTVTALTFDAGVKVYRGGDLVSADSTEYLVRTEGTDQRASGTGADISTWTLDGTLTGHFDATASTTYVGEGSRVMIADKFYTITAYTNAATSNSVTLSESVASGEVQFIGPMYDWSGAAAGTVIPAGFSLAGTNKVNVSGSLIEFEAGLFD